MNIDFPTNTDKLTTFLGQLSVLRDPCTWEHSKRVSTATSFLAATVGLILDWKELDRAAFLHDIGKVAISDAIINKPTRLTDEEYKIVQQHTVLGYKLIQPLELGRVVGNAILYHHENFDGSGYPYGLSGEAIPLEARLIRVTDVFDALTSPRPYRGAYSRLEAMKIMLENRTCFDPIFFEAFLWMERE